MNTRIQVEHPVTEMITGIDLVREMIRICRRRAAAIRAGRRDDARPCHRGAHQCRGPGEELHACARHGDALRVPGGPGTRFDTMLYQGYQVPPFYDSLLGKLIVWDETRDGAIARMAAPWTNSRSRAWPPPSRCTNCWRTDRKCCEGDFHTRWLEPWLEPMPTD